MGCSPDGDAVPRWEYNKRVNSPRIPLSPPVILMMTIILTLACDSFGPAASKATPMAPAASGAKRAIWVWEKDTNEMVDDKAFRNHALSFLREQGVSILYLYADTYQGRNVLTDEPGKYRNLIAELHRRGFEVYALLGSWYLKTPEYILPSKRRAAVRMFRDVLAFNEKGDTGSRFDGVNFDIEPYLLDDWNARKTLRATQYLDLGAEFMRMKKEARSSMILGPAMPFWFDGIRDLAWKGRRKRLSEHVQDVYDYVAIMDYRNFAEGRDGMISHARDELAYADSIGRSVVIGVDMGLSKPAKVTFYGKSRADLEKELLLAESAFSPHRSFTGFAVHHLRTYQDLVASGIAPQEAP